FALNAVNKRQEVDAARQAMKQAIESTAVLVERSPRVGNYRGLLNMHYFILSQVELRGGDLDASVEVARRRLALWEDNAEELVVFASELSRAAKSLPKSKDAQREAWLAEAMGALKKAARLGYNDVKRLREHGDLAPLRGSKEFESLIADIVDGK